MVCYITSTSVINSVCFPLHSTMKGEVHCTVVVIQRNFNVVIGSSALEIDRTQSSYCKPELRTRPADVGLESNLFYHTHMFCYVF